MRLVTKISIGVVAVLMVVFIGAVAYRMSGYGSTSEGSILPLPQLAQSPTPGPTLADALAERMGTCSSDVHAQFAKEAPLINDSFEDSYLLALSSPKIALTQVVRDMQGAHRQLAALPVDDCARPVQEDLLKAYEKATDMFLKFMQGGNPPVSTLLEEFDLRDATEKLEIYVADPVAFMFNSDYSRRNELITSGQQVPPELAYLQGWLASDAHSQCVQALPLFLAQNTAYAKTKNRFDAAAIGKPAEDEDKATEETKDPCASIPVVTDSVLTNVSYRLKAADASAAQATYVWISMPAGADTFTKTVDLPLAVDVQMLTGHRASVSAFPAADGKAITCELLVNSQVVISDTAKEEHDAATCGAVLQQD